ncbi:MAG: fluoride efflux transporter CrcB [Calditrichia bacterium]
MYLQMLIVGVGGFVGAILRFILSGWGNSLVENGFPAGTFLVNVIGCFLLGTIYGTASQFTASPNLKLFLATGLLGALTTFSTFSLETISLVQNSEFQKALLNIIGSLVVGIAAGYAGIALGRFFTAS